ncbi:DUF6879 family protein [Streptomyces sp. NPDC051217]|uniref:DUF6879 family protein n=1 Tax=Streptomyces sp. NPDC051217 TaxID=3365644 RepID=UPI0037A6DE95
MRPPLWPVLSVIVCPPVGPWSELRGIRPSRVWPEDIRVIARAEAERLELPDYDLWLFDSRTLVRMHIDESDTTIGVELINDPDRVLAACRARDAATAAARPTVEVWAHTTSRDH